MSGTQLPSKAEARRNKRQTYVNSIQGAFGQCNAPEFEQMTAIMLTNYLSALEKHFKRFDEEHMGYLAENTLTPVELQEQYAIYEGMEKVMFQLRNKLALKIQQLQPVAVERHDEAQPIRVELSTAELSTGQNTWGKFNGNLFEWQSFRDKFTAAVHLNPRIQAVFKLQHLLSSLEGSAARVVGTRQSTDDGYQGAWDRLCEVYNDEYMLVRAILRTLFALPAIEQPTQNAFRRLIDTMHEAVRQLGTLQVPVVGWDQILVYMMTERLDSRTIDEWEMQREPGLPTLSQICAFLEKKVRSLAHAHNDQPKVGHKRRNNGDRAGQSFAHNKPTSYDAPPRQGGTSTPFVCKCCQGSHPLYKCTNFTNTIKHRKRSNHISCGQ